MIRISGISKWKFFIQNCVFFCRRVVLLVDELIKTEETYVNVLQKGIEGYAKIFKGELPPTLRGRENAIFGNLKRVYEFHSEILLPDLKECSGDIEKISSVFLKLIKEEYFYCHVLYAMNCSKSKKICEDHEQFFSRIMEDIGDRLGILSLLLQPIQRVPRYKLLLENVLEELGKQIEASPEVKSQLAATSRAWKAVEKLAACVNASVNVNYITECYEVKCGISVDPWTYFLKIFFNCRLISSIKENSEILKLLNFMTTIREGDLKGMYSSLKNALSILNIKLLRKILTSTVDIMHLLSWEFWRMSIGEKCLCSGIV